MPTLADELGIELTSHIIPFWKNLRDLACGGYFGRVDAQCNVHKHADKGCILNSRILWFFSKAALFVKDVSLREYADHAYRFMVEHCVDVKQGGLYWAVRYDGQIADDTKHTYNQAFAIYALSAYYQLTAEPNALQMAFSLVDIIENRCRDDGGYLEAFTRDFRPTSNEKLSENGVLATRTMNTLLHVFEGYSGLYEATKSAEIGQKLRDIIALFLTRIYNYSARRQEVFFDHSYHSLINLHSYGHDIESAWLLDWGCSLLQDDNLQKRLRPVLMEIADHVYKAAYRDHSIRNECDNGLENEARVWWVQAEAMVGFLHAWQMEPNRTEYRNAVDDIWRFVLQHLIDSRPGGEWFWQVDGTGCPDRQKDIVDQWKCPYHNGRMCIEMIRRLT